MHLVEVCVSVCLRDNLKTIADICFLLGNYIDWRKSQTSSQSRSQVKVKVIFGGFKVTRQVAILSQVVQFHRRLYFYFLFFSIIKRLTLR